MCLGWYLMANNRKEKFAVDWKRRIQRLRNNKGETLLEVLVATAIFALLSVLMVSLIMGATQANTSARRLQKEDMQIMELIDNDGAEASVVETKDTEVAADGASKFEIKIDTGTGAIITVASDGKYYKVKGSGGIGAVMVRFVPKTIY